MPNLSPEQSKQNQQLTEQYNIILREVRSAKNMGIEPIKLLPYLIKNYPLISKTLINDTINDQYDCFI
jgi:hypothetical protein